MIYIVEDETSNTLDKSGLRLFTKLQTLVDKFNALRREAIDLTGSDDDIYYDNSSTFDSGPEYIGEVSLSVREGFVVMAYEVEETHGWSMRKERHLNETRYPIEEGWFNIDIFKDDLSYMTKCVRRAMKYFREVNPDMEEDEIDNLMGDGEDLNESIVIVEGLKTFRITCIKHGNVRTYNQEAYIQAASEKMALKKFFNQKDSYGTTFKQSMEYERDANGIYYTDWKATEVKDERDIPSQWDWELHTI